MVGCRVCIAGHPIQSQASRGGLLRKEAFEMKQDPGEAERTRKLVLCSVQLVKQGDTGCRVPKTILVIKLTLAR